VADVARPGFQAIKPFDGRTYNERYIVAELEAEGTWGMIKLKVDDANRILMVEMKGMVSEDDIDQAIGSLQQEYPGVGVHLRGGERPFSVLADWQELEGWERGAKTLGTMTSKIIGDSAHKIAVIADDRFAEEKPRLVDVFPNATVRFFAPQQREEALRWLRRH
jgi:hypothetical protein